jgi:hypothetical protein
MRGSSLSISVLLVGAVAVFSFAAGAQQPAAPAPGSARAVAPVDLTGNWVSVVTEDWRYRMVTPPKGDYASVPLNGEGRRTADTWDPAKDEASGNQCRSYGAPAIMRVPTRLRISWQDDNTLKVETDAGMQTRLFRFGTQSLTPGVEPDWQGFSAANWEMAGGAGGFGFGPPGGAPPPAGGGGPGRGARAGGPPPPASRGGSLKVVTRGFKSGYLRRNGVPYSENAVVTEYFDRHTEANGDEWFTVTVTVEDPKYLGQPFITSSSFKKERDGSKWNPTPCKVG